MYFDTHVHLNSEQLYAKRDEYIQHALAKKVTNMVVVGYDLASSKRAVEIAQEYDFIYAAVAIGPQDCKDISQEDLDQIEILLQEPKVVALGETGLDYYWDTVAEDVQKWAFQKQIELAVKYQKPLVIHCRDAYEDTYQMLKDAQHYGVMHCYSGSSDMAKRFIDIDFYISLAGPVTFKNAKKPKAVAASIPLEKLLIETDCPYLAPHPLRGTQNEPANVIFIAREIAEIKNLETEVVAEETAANAKKLFGIK